jgi:hypothetical protein
MKKDVFRLRHAALVAALAVAMGVTPAFADETVADVTVADVPVLQPGADVEPAPVDEPVVAVEPGTSGDETPVDMPVVLDDPLPEPDAGVVDEGAPAEEPVAIDEPAPEVVDEPLAVEDPVPVDDCGMMCWNVADIPPEAVQRGGEDIDPRIMEFGAAPDPALNVGAEVSGAVSVSEQLGAADVALDNDATVEPLATAIAPTVTTTTNTAAVNVIRDGHLR